MAACFPIPEAEASREIRELIKDRGIDALTSKIIRKHLQSKFNFDNLSNYKALIDSLTLEQINKIKKEDNKKEEESPISDSANSSASDEEPQVEVKKEVKNSGVKRAALATTSTVVKKVKSWFFSLFSL